jgi:hypothetical protein
MISTATVEKARVQDELSSSFAGAPPIYAGRHDIVIHFGVVDLHARWMATIQPWAKADHAVGTMGLPVGFC